MKKLDSVKKPKSLVGILFYLVLLVSIISTLAVSGLIVVSYFAQGKTDVINDIVFPVLRSLLVILPIDGLAVFALFSLASIYRLLNKKNVVVKNINSFFDLSRSDYLIVDECDVLLGNKCSIKEIVSLGKENVNEITDIACSIASKISNSDPLIMSLYELSYIPLFSSLTVNENNGAYLAEFKDQKYVLGRYGSFKYRSEEFVKTKVEPYLLKGYEICLIGSYKKDKYAEFADVFGIIVMKNDVNENLRNDIRQLQNDGISVLVLSSSSTVSASENAKAIGIKNAEKYIDINNPNFDISNVKDYVVFGGLSSSDKEVIITQLERERKIVATISNSGGVTSSNCSISYGDKGDIILADSSTSLVDVVNESKLFKNKLRKLFALLMYKTVFVSLYLIAVSALSISGLAYNLKAIGLGALLSLASMLMMILDKESSNERKLRYRLITSLILETLSIGAVFLLYYIQKIGHAYTGLNDYNGVLTVCGVIFIVSNLIFLVGLFIPFNKRRIALFGYLTLLSLVITGTIFGLSLYLSQEVFGLSFNVLNGQNYITILIISIIYIALYLVTIYIFDNYNKEGDE